MIKRFCDCCGVQLPEGDMGLATLEFMIATKTKGLVKLCVVPSDGGPPGLAADVCQECIIDAIIAADERPREGVI